VLGELPCYALGLAGEVGDPPGLVRVALEYSRGAPAGASEVNDRSACPFASAGQSQCKCNTILACSKAVRDSEWSAGHIAAHGVSLEEVREAILEHPYWAAPGRDGTTLVYGRTYAGRYLLVVVIGEGQEAFVVTARDMTEAEKKTFRRKAR
jgi:uncharacterized protein